MRYNFMNVKLIQESSIEDSYIFQYWSTNAELRTKIIKYLRGAVDVDETHFEEQILQIRKSRISPLVDAVLGAYARGEIRLMYNKNEKIPIAVPFIIQRDPEFNGNLMHVRATIFLSNYTSADKMGNFTIQMKQLYVLLESAYIGLYIYLHPSSIQRNLGLMRITCEMYTEMAMKIFNKEFALSLDPDLYARVCFAVSRFYLERVWELKNKDVVFNVAQICIKRPNVPDLTLVSSKYDESNVNTIEDLIEFIKGLSPRLGELGIKYYIQRYTFTYHGGAMMSIDYLPFLFFVMIDTLLGGFLINNRMTNEIIKNQSDIKHFYGELAKTINYQKER